MDDISFRRAAATVLATMTVLASCGTQDTPTPPRSTPVTSTSASSAAAGNRPEVRFAKLVLPSDARILQVHSDEGGMDHLVLLKLRMRSRDRDAFLSGSGLPQPQQSLNAIQQGIGRKLGWRLDGLKRFEGMTDESGPVRQVVIDTSDAATLTVYVAAFST